MDRSFVLYNTRDQGYAKKHRDNPCEIIALMWEERHASRYTKGEAEFVIQSQNKDWEIRTATGLPLPVKNHSLPILDSLERKVIRALINKEIKAKKDSKLSMVFENILKKI